MKKLWIACTALIAGISMNSIADARCTTDPGQMGWDAAQQACFDIIQSWVPLPSYRAYRARVRDFDPEVTCTLNQVVECKNAMAQYLRSGSGANCAALIRQNANLSGGPGGGSGTAQGVWRAYVETTCNLR